MSDDDASGTEASEMEVLKPEALVERMKQAHPDLGEALSDRQLGVLTRRVLQAFAAELNERDEARLRMPGLGRIQIRQVEREKGGEAVLTKRISLRLSDSKD